MSRERFLPLTGRQFFLGDLPPSARTAVLKEFQAGMVSNVPQVMDTLKTHCGYVNVHCMSACSLPVLFCKVPSISATL